jgi:hypothetical protein
MGLPGGTGVICEALARIVGKRVEIRTGTSRIQVYNVTPTRNLRYTTPPPTTTVVTVLN